MPSRAPSVRATLNAYAPKRSPLVLYEFLLAAVDGLDEGERVQLLRGHLAQPPTSWPPALRAVVEDADVTVGYLTRGLLSIHRFAPDVRQALAAGLPFAVSRLVNGLPTAAGRARVQAPLSEAAGHEGAFLPRSVSAAVERLALGGAPGARDRAAGGFTPIGRGPLDAPRRHRAPTAPHEGRRLVA